MIRTIASLFLVVSWIPAFISFILHLQSKQKNNVYWKFIFGLLFCILSILTVSSIRIFDIEIESWKVPEWFDYVRFGLYFTLPFILWWLVYLMVKARRKERDGEYNPPTEPHS